MTTRQQDNLNKLAEYLGTLEHDEQTYFGIVAVSHTHGASCISMMHGEPLKDKGPIPEIFVTDGIARLMHYVISISATEREKAVQQDEVRKQAMQNLSTLPREDIVKILETLAQGEPKNAQ